MKVYRFESKSAGTLRFYMMTGGSDAATHTGIFFEATLLVKQMTGPHKSVAYDVGYDSHAGYDIAHRIRMDFGALDLPDDVPGEIVAIAHDPELEAQWKERATYFVGEDKKLGLTDQQWRLVVHALEACAPTGGGSDAFHLANHIAGAMGVERDDDDDRAVARLQITAAEEFLEGAEPDLQLGGFLLKVGAWSVIDRGNDSYVLIPSPN